MGNWPSDTIRSLHRERCQIDQTSLKLMSLSSYQGHHEVHPARARPCAAHFVAILTLTSTGAAPDHGIRFPKTYKIHFAFFIKKQIYRIISACTQNSRESIHGVSLCSPAVHCPSASQRTCVIGGIIKKMDCTS